MKRIDFKKQNGKDKESKNLKKPNEKMIKRLKWKK